MITFHPSPSSDEIPEKERENRDRGFRASLLDQELLPRLKVVKGKPHRLCQQTHVLAQSGRRRLGYGLKEGIRPCIRTVLYRRCHPRIQLGWVRHSGPGSFERLAHSAHEACRLCLFLNMAPCSHLFVAAPSLCPGTCPLHLVSLDLYFTDIAQVFGYKARLILLSLDLPLPPRHSSPLSKTRGPVSIRSASFLGLPLWSCSVELQLPTSLFNYLAVVIQVVSCCCWPREYIPT